MGLRHPRRRLRTGAVLDFEDAGALADGFVEELTGRLNEHNFNGAMRAQLAAERSRLSPNYAWRTAWAAEDSGGLNFLSCTGPTESSWVSSNIARRMPLDWVPVIGVEVFSPEGGWARVVAGAQYHASRQPPPVGLSTTNNIARPWSSYWAVRVNQAVPGQDVNGDQDDGELPQHGERGYGGFVGAAKVDTLVYLPAGRSFVDLVFRAAEKGAYDPAGFSSYVYEVVTNREIVVLELAR